MVKNNGYKRIPNKQYLLRLKYVLSEVKYLLIILISKFELLNSQFFFTVH